MNFNRYADKRNVDSLSGLDLSKGCTKLNLFPVSLCINKSKVAICLLSDSLKNNTLPAISVGQECKPLRHCCFSTCLSHTFEILCAAAQLNIVSPEV